MLNRRAARSAIGIFISLFSAVSLAEAQALPMCPAAPANVAVERLPYRQHLNFNISQGQDLVTKSLLTVPAGKNLTLEHVGAIFMAEGSPTYFMRLVVNFLDVGGYTVTTGLWQGAQVGHIRTLNQPTRIDLAGGEEVFVQVQRSTKGFTNIKVMVDGYLTDMPCARAAGQ